MNTNKTKSKKMSLLKKRVLRLSLLSMALTFMCSSFAQSDWKASVGAQLYFAELKAENGLLDTDYNPGVGVNLGIAYALNENWSINSGLGLSYIETSTSIGNYSDQVDAVDMEGENFEFRYRLDQYSEYQKSMMLSIPIAVQYETKGNQTRFYSKIGASVNLFLDAKSQGEANTLITSGYYERFNAELTVPRFAGFGTFENIEFSERDLEINNSFNAFLEVGVKENFGAGRWIYFGLFAEYGLNDLLENKGTSLIDYNTNMPTDFINNSSLNASRQTNGAAFFDKVTLNIIGLRVKYEFGI
jgi:outer membrane protein W